MAFDQDRVRDVASRVAASSGLEVVEIEFHGSGKTRMLRVFIDRLPQAGVAAGEGGVTHEDCANFSREFGTILDVEDAVPGGPYTLEVSSPGLDRKLSRPADFERFTGSRVKLMTRTPVQGNRHFVGRLEGCSEGCVVLDVSPERKKTRGASDEEKKIEIALSNIEKANLVPEI
jgi:ribosome maturation factor RimP